MKGRKDISKLVKKVITTKDGRRMTVYVRPEEEKKSIIAKIFEFFGFLNSDVLKEKLKKDYEEHHVYEKTGLDHEGWIYHVEEYFKNREKWVKFFEGKQKQPTDKVKKKVKVKKDGKVKKKVVAAKISLTAMRLIHQLYGGLDAKTKHSDRPGAVSGSKQDETRVPDRRGYTHVETPRTGGDGGEHIRDDSAVGERSRTSTRVSKKKIKDIRARIKEILETKKDIEITDEEKEILKKYEGQGGLGEEGASVHGTLYEFYTPTSVVNKVWDIVETVWQKMTGGRTPMSILEPSAGIGRFAERAKPGDKVKMVEIDPVSARIARILHPDKEVKEGAFQQLFFNEKGQVEKQYKGEKYNLVIGNPPYGAYSGRWKGEGEGKEHTRYEEYFIDRGLDTLEEGGLLAYVVPSGWLQSGNDKIKEKIAEKGKLIAAYRLPNGTFATTGVGTDIVILRKEKGSSEDLSNDKYFKDNPENIIGIEKTRTDRFGKLEKYIALPEGENFDTVLQRIDPNKIDVPPIGRKPMTEETKEAISIALKGNRNAEGKHEGAKVKIERDAKTKREYYRVYPKTEGNYTVDEFKKEYGRQFDELDLAVWDANTWDGSVDIEKLDAKTRKAFEASDKICYMGGKVYHALIYATGDIYEKLDKLEKEKEKLEPKVYERQKALLQSVLPKRRGIKEISLTPISTFVKNYKFGDGMSLIDKFIEWAGVVQRWGEDEFYGGVTPHDLEGGISWGDVLDYINGIPVEKERVRPGDSEAEKDRKEQLAELRREKRRVVAYKVFQRFLREGLNEEEQKQVEDKYNRAFNSHAEPNYKNIPFYINGLSKEFKGKKLKINDIQLEGASFLTNKGVGLLAYGVGVGKTMTGAIATVRNMQAGKCKRPVFIVPKSTYWKWIGELKDMFPGIKINELGNLGVGVTPEIEDGTLSIMTYEGLQTLTLKEENYDKLLADIRDTIALEDRKSDRERAQQAEKIEEKTGKAVRTKRNRYYIEDLGFDHVTIDEAHNFKNVFGQAKVTTGQEEKEEEKFALFRKKKKMKKVANEFQQIVGGTSDRAAKAYMLTNYIQEKNNGKNVFLLTATPFTNSPLEIYNILSLMAKPRLKQLGINNLNDFMSHFVEIKNEWVSTTKGTIERKDVVKSFKDLPALQSLIKEYIDFRSTKEAGIEIPKQQEVVVELPMTPLQKKIMDAEVARYERKGKLDERTFEGKMQAEEEALKGFRGDEAGAVFKAINNMRQATLTPKIIKPDAFHHYVVDEIERAHPIADSPKLKFTTECAAEVYKAKPNVGQVIYMPRGIEAYDEMVKYMVERGVPRDAIAYIHSSAPSEEKKEKIIKEFNDPNGKIKILIGSETIKEGIDLNGNSAVLYNTFLDWNPSSTIQVNGRITRQGNRQANTFIVHPVLTDSVDSAMYQKHDEKMSRFGEVWSYKGADSLDVSDINPADLKYEIIKDPAKRAGFKISLMKEQHENRKREIRIQIDSLKIVRNNIAGEKREVETLSGAIKELQEEYEKFRKLLDESSRELERLENAGVSKGTQEYAEAFQDVNYYRNMVDRYSRSLTDNKAMMRRHQKRLEKYLEQLHRHSVSEENIDTKIAEYEREIENVNGEIKKIEQQRAELVKIAEEEIRQSQKEVPSVDEAVKNYAKYILENIKTKNIEGEEEAAYKAMVFVTTSGRRLGAIVYRGEKMDDLIKAGRKDISKLVKKVITTKDNRRMTVYVRPEEEKKSIIQKMLEFFGFKTDDALKSRLLEDYDRHKIEERTGLDHTGWMYHVEEYFKNRDRWAKFFDRPKKGEKQPTKEVKKTVKVKKGGKVESKNVAVKISLSAMKIIHELYGGKHAEEPKEESGRAGDHERAADTVASGRVHRVSSEKQPYADYGIIVARENDYQRPKDNYISESIAGALRPHQADFVNLAIEGFKSGEKATLNMDGTGAGKTRQELALAHTYAKVYKRPAIIVTENIRIVDNAFRKDAEAMGLKIKILEKGEKVTLEEDTIYVTLYNRLDEQKETIALNFKLCIFDESHNLKNVKSQKTIAAKKIMDFASHRALFSATPLDKAEHIHYVTQAFGLSNSRTMMKLGYELVTKNIGRGRKIQTYEAKESKEEIANRIYAFFNDLTKKGMAVKREVSLDNLDFGVRLVELTEEQQKKYNSLMDQMSAELSEERGNIGLKKATWLMKVRRFLEEMKKDETVKSIEAGLKEGRQIVIFATRVNEIGDEETEDQYSVGTLKDISRILEEKGIPHANVYGDAKNPAEEIAKFNSGEAKVILTTPQSGGTGVNLDDTDGNRPRKAIIMTPPFSAMDMIQQLGRINRLTTKSRAECEMLVTKTSIDAWNTNIIARKISKLGATVAGDYAKIDDSVLDTVSMMSNEDMKEYLKGKNVMTEMVEYDESRNINVDELRLRPKPGTIKFVPQTLRNIDHYRTYVPVKDGMVDYSMPFPDAMIGFGKYQGLKLSQLVEKDRDYAAWFFKNLNVRVSEVKFATEESAEEAKKEETVEKANRLIKKFILNNVIIKAVVR